MADNVTIPTTGTGDITPVIATDQVVIGNPSQTAHIQFMKLVDGTYDSATSIHGTGHRELLVSERTLLFGDSFNAALSTNDWTTNNVSGGTSTVSNSSLVQVTNTTANATTQLIAVPIHRLLPGSYNVFTAHVAFGDTGTANNVRNLGAYSANDGFFFQLASGGIGIVSRKAASDTVVAHGAFNGQDFTMDTNFHKYDIVYGGNEAWFYIDNIIRHKISGVTATTITNNTDFQIQLQNNNSGGATTNVSATYHHAGLWRMGHPLQRSRNRHFVTSFTNTVIKTGPGTLRRVVIMDNPTTTATIQLGDHASSSSTNIIATLRLSTARTVDLDIDFYNGLTGTLSNAADVLFIFD